MLLQVPKHYGPKLHILVSHGHANAFDRPHLPDHDRTPQIPNPGKNLQRKKPTFLSRREFRLDGWTDCLLEIRADIEEYSCYSRVCAVGIN